MSESSTSKAEERGEGKVRGSRDDKFTRVRQMNLFTSNRTRGVGRAAADGSDTVPSAGETTIARMAAGKKKQAENISFQIECETDAQWRNLLRREGLIVVDVYASWAGPCISMISTLKKVKIEVNDDKLWLAIACSDNIGDLQMFKDQSEPTWLFIGGGKPVKVLRGANAPKLVTTMKSEFERELLCMQGKQKRNLISIDDEVSRRRKAEAEAMRLVKLIKEEEDDEESNVEMRRNSSLRLIQLMKPYTVLVIQNFLLETGVVTEIRDALQGDFKIEQERLVYLDEAAIRQLFRIPYKIPDPTEPLDLGEDFGYNEDDEVAEDENVTEGGEDGEGKVAEEGEEGAVEAEPKKKGKREKKMLTIHLPDGLVGDTLIMLLESIDVRKMIAAGKTPDKNAVLQTADDYIQLKVGPVVLKDALEHAPYSFHALYGRGKYEPGAWCPRKYDDKRYVMVNFFPRFVTEIIMPEPKGAPKYTVALYPATMATEISNQIEVYKKDVLAEGTVKIPPALAEEMVKTWSIPDQEEVQSKKKAITSNQVYAISVNKRNSRLMLALQALDPIHVSYDASYGKVETSKLFTNLKISLDDMPNPDEVVEKFLARTTHRVPSLSEFKPSEMPKSKKQKAEGEGEEESSERSGSPESNPPAAQAPSGGGEEDGEEEEGEASKHHKAGAEEEDEEEAG